MIDASSSEPERSSIRPANAAALVAVWVFGFLILRIFAVSAYNWDTAFAVSTTLSLNDGVSLLFGSLMAGELFTAGLLAALLPLLFAASLWGPRGHRSVLMLLTAIGAVLAAAITISFHCWWLATTQSSPTRGVERCEEHRLACASLVACRRCPCHNPLGSS